MNIIRIIMKIIGNRNSNSSSIRTSNTITTNNINRTTFMIITITIIQK